MPYLISIGFLRGPVPSALAKGRVINIMLPTHPYSKSPGAYTSDQLTPVIDRLQTAADEAKTRAVDKVAALKVARLEYNNMFKNLARHMEIWANGDPSKLVNSGFDLRKEPKKTVSPRPLGAPEVSVSHGPGEGTMLVDFSSVDGAKIFILFIASSDPSVEGNWELFNKYSRRTKNLVTDRVPGQNYWLKGCCFGAAGEGPMSAPVCLRAL